MHFVHLFLRKIRLKIRNSVQGNGGFQIHNLNNVGSLQIDAATKES